MTESLTERNYKIFVVDDAPEVREILSASLIDTNWKAEIFASGESAIEACRKGMPDLLISDITMPGISGRDLCKWVKENSIDEFVPVILVTSLDSLEDKISGLDEGADDYITKPFSIEELRARVRAMLRIKRLADELRLAKSVIAEKEKLLVASTIAAGTAHELGQPLCALILNCRVLSSNTLDEPEKQELVAAIEQQCADMKSILGKLSNLEKFAMKDYLKGKDILSIED